MSDTHNSESARRVSGTMPTTGAKFEGPVLPAPDAESVAACSWCHGKAGYHLQSCHYECERLGDTADMLYAAVIAYVRGDYGSAKLVDAALRAYEAVSRGEVGLAHIDGLEAHDG